MTTVTPIRTVVHQYGGMKQYPVTLAAATDGPTLQAALIAAFNPTQPVGDTTSLTVYLGEVLLQSDGVLPGNWVSVSSGDGTTWAADTSGNTAHTYGPGVLYLTVEADSPTPSLADVPDPVLPDGVVFDSTPVFWALQPGSDVVATTLDDLGLLAIVDDPAAAVVGDIAYLVSGYPENAFQIAVLIAGSQYIEFPSTEGSYAVPAGAYAEIPTLGTRVYGGASGGTIEVDAGSNVTLTGDAEYSNLGATYWPYIERYNLRTKTWLPRISTPEVTPGHLYAAEGGMAAGIDGKLYFGGGDGDNIVGNEFFVYDPTTETFERLPDLGTAYPDFPDYDAWGVLDGALYYFAGNASTGGHKFDPVTRTWTQFTYTGLRPPMDQYVGVAIDGKLYFVAGNGTKVFDPVALSFTPLAGLPFDADYPGFQFPAVVWGPPFTVVGRNGDTTYAPRAYEYDPVQDAWSQSDEVAIPFVDRPTTVVHQGVPYVLRGVITSDSVRLPGIYGLTGNVVPPPSTTENTMPSDPNAPATEPDTTVGGGGDFTPGSDDPQYEPPPDQAGPAADERETDTTSGGTQAGRTGDTDSHLRDPRATGPDTTVPGGEAGGIGRTGDVDSHSHDPQPLGDTTVLGGGVGATSTGQPYRPPSNPPGASNFDTSSRSGVLSVNPGSPDAAVVGSGSGINPNAVEPGVTATSYDAAAGQRDTTYAGSPAFTTVPAQAGTPGAPGKPTIAAISGRAACHVTWTAPSDAVAKGVVGYIINTNTGGEMEVGKSSLSAEFEQGLVPGQTYTFTVFARTSNGTGPRSAPSDPFTVPKADSILPDTERDEGL